jgi:EPS-associated MarR family transcriptional regulator
MLTDEYRYRILKLLEANPKASQREIARELGISLGKVNYCLKALIERGWVKANNFRQTERKRVYLYLLTPQGVEAKAKVTVRFLKRKLDEYETLKRDLAELQLDADNLKKRGQPENGR